MINTNGGISISVKVFEGDGAIRYISDNEWTDLPYAELVAIQKILVNSLKSIQEMGDAASAEALAGKAKVK